MTLKSEVRHILLNYPATRNSDILLTIQLWKTFHDGQLITGKDGTSKYINIETLFDLPREDHIKRYRAFIQNKEGCYLPTDPKILKERKINLNAEWSHEMSA